MEPCRRRAIWAAQAAVTNAVQPEISHEKKDETRNDADAVPEGGLDGYNGSDHEAVSARADVAERKKTRSVKVKADSNKPTAKKEVKKTPCPKCGKQIGRGMYFHQKYCKG